MKRRFQVTPRALSDLGNIGRYTLGRWGAIQRNDYLRAIDKRFAWLAENPLLGRHRPDIEQGFYCFPQGSHLIFYTRQESHIAIIGVPHSEMDFVNYFEQ